MGGAATMSTHDLLLAIAGRVDDDLLTWARELVAVGEDGRAIELVSAALIADQAQLPATVRAALVTAGRAGRTVLDVDGALPPPHEAADPAHEFDATPPGSAAEPITAALSELLDSQPVDCRMWVSWRLTPAGSAPGPLPHPVVLVELPGDAPTGADILAYQFATALERADVPASVEVFSADTTLPAYHTAARHAGQLLRSGAAARPDDEPAQRTTPALSRLGPISPPGATEPDPEPTASVTELPRYRRQLSSGESLSRFATAAPPEPDVEPEPVGPVAQAYRTAPEPPEPAPAPPVPADVPPPTPATWRPTEPSPPAPAMTWEPTEPSPPAPANPAPGGRLLESTVEPRTDLPASSNSGAWLTSPEATASDPADRPSPTAIDVLDDLVSGPLLEPLLDPTPEPASEPAAAASFDPPIDRNDPLGLDNLFVSQTEGTGGFDPIPRGIPRYVPPEPFHEPARGIPGESTREPAGDRLDAPTRDPVAEMLGGPVPEARLDSPLEPVREIPRYNPLGSLHAVPADTPGDPATEALDDSLEPAHALQVDPDPETWHEPDLDDLRDTSPTPIHGIPQDRPRAPTHRVAQEAAREVAREWELPPPPGPTRWPNPPIGSPGRPPLAPPERPMPQRFDPTPATRSGASAAYRPPPPRSQPDVEAVTPIHGIVPVAPIDAAPPNTVLPSTTVPPSNAGPPTNAALPGNPIDASRLGLRPDSLERLSPTDRALLARLQNEMGLHGPGPQNPAPPRRWRPPNPNPGPVRPRPIRSNPPDIAG